jgi:hypothetical protein
MGHGLLQAERRAKRIEKADTAHATTAWGADPRTVALQACTTPRRRILRAADEPPQIVPTERRHG